MVRPSGSTCCRGLFDHFTHGFFLRVQSPVYLIFIFVSLCSAVKETGNDPQAHGGILSLSRNVFLHSPVFSFPWRLRLRMWVAGSMSDFIDTRCYWVCYALGGCRLAFLRPSKLVWFLKDEGGVYPVYAMELRLCMGWEEGRDPPILGIS
jgi:hypothetical protein